MFNPYPSLAGGARPEGASTAKTASYATVGAAGSKDSPVDSPNPRSSPNARTAPHAAAEAVPKDSPAAPGPQDSSSRQRISSTKTAAYPTVGAEDPKPSDSTRSPIKTGAAPVLPFNFLRPAAKTGEAGEPTRPEDPKGPGRKKP